MKKADYIYRCHNHNYQCDVMLNKQEEYCKDNSITLEPLMKHFNFMKTVLEICVSENIRKTSHRGLMLNNNMHSIIICEHEESNLSGVLLVKARLKIKKYVAIVQHV